MLGPCEYMSSKSTHSIYFGHVCNVMCSVQLLWKFFKCFIWVLMHKVVGSVYVLRQMCNHSIYLVSISVTELLPALEASCKVKVGDWWYVTSSAANRFCRQRRSDQPAEVISIHSSWGKNEYLHAQNFHSWNNIMKIKKYKEASRIMRYVLPQNLYPSSTLSPPLLL